MLKENIMLQESDLDLSVIFHEMPCGAALHKLECDISGLPVDYIPLMVNKAFGRIMGVEEKAILGIKAGDRLSRQELAYWLELFAPVALEGKTVHFQMSGISGKRPLHGTAVCPAKGFFFVMFSDACVGQD